MTDNTKQINIGKRTVKIGGVTRTTCSDLDKHIDDNDKSERVVIGHSQVSTGKITYTASKNWIARNLQQAKIWQKARGYA